MVLPKTFLLVNKPNILEAATSATKLVNVKLDKDENLLLPKHINIGLGAQKALKEVPEEKISQLRKLEFFNDCRQIIIAMIAKVIERSPLKHS